MYRECIHANRGWKGKSCHDTVFVKVFEDDDHDMDSQIMCGMLVACVLLFFSFHDPLMDREIPCTLVNWFMPVSEQQDDVMGMWEFRLEMVGARLTLEVIALSELLTYSHTMVMSSFLKILTRQIHLMHSDLILLMTLLIITHMSCYRTVNYFCHFFHFSNIRYFGGCMRRTFTLFRLLTLGRAFLKPKS